MRHTSLFLLASVCLILLNCKPSQKSVSTTTATTTTTTAPAGTTEPAPVGPVMKPRNGVYAPGNEELAAIQATYKDVTMQTLSQGHALYTGVCTNCHRTYSIYTIQAGTLKPLIDDMAMRAKLTDVEKDAVYKYVLAIKATQPK